MSAYDAPRDDDANDSTLQLSHARDIHLHFFTTDNASALIHASDATRTRQPAPHLLHDGQRTKCCHMQQQKATR